MIDIRAPLGLLFLLIGAVLVLFGLTSDEAIYAASLGVNINLAWGAVMVLFGALMLAIAALGRRRSG